MSASIILEEKVNKLRVSYLLETYTFDVFYANWNGKKGDGKKEYNKIIKYLNDKLNAKHDYVKYNYVKGRTSGRLIGDNTIQSCNRNIRGFICDGLTTDIDMDNAHPTILLSLCDKYDIQAPNLKLYVNERKKCLLDIQEKDNVNYKTAKQKVLISTNLDFKITTKSEFLKNYDKEMKYLHKKFLDIDDFNYVKEYAKKDNFEGSFINHVLCVNENEILTNMRTFCDINEIKIHSLMFDGLMLYGNINEHTLKELQQYVNENTIFDKMKLSIKEHEYDFEMPDNYVPKKRVLYEDVKEEFEKYNCKVGAEFVCEKHNDFNVYNRSNFNILHEEMTFTCDDGNECCFMSKWFSEPNKRKYDKYDTIPKDSMCPDYVYNMWEKLPVELMPCVEKDIKVEKALNWFLNHVKVLTDYNTIHYDFIIMWLAQMFQYPENKSIQLIFIGDEGSGKGTFVKFLTTIMGGSHRCFNTADPQADIFDKFNDCMKKAFLVVMNEADKSGTYNNNSKLKDLITEPFINIRPKGEKSFSMRSVHRFMSFSNNPDPTTKNKRRDFTMKTSSDKIGNVDYFTEGNLYANDIVCCKYIYDYLMKQKTKPVITDNDIPIGEYDEMLKEVQKDNLIDFFEELTYLNIDKTEPKIFTSNNLYELFIDYCKRNYIQYYGNKGSFTTKLFYKKINGMEKKVKKIEKVATNVYIIDFKLLKKSLNLKDYDEVLIEDTDGYDTD
tara:strand:- start:356 stop:2521 length:2166 start_codon:yes stop_codon:yes gene_type:complete